MAVTLGQRIAKARRRLDWNQTELGQELGVSQAQISNWETGKQQPSTEELTRLEKILGGALREPTFADWLVRTRESRELSQRELAERAGLSVPAIYNIESGKSQNPRKATVSKLKRALGNETASDEARSTEDELQGSIGALVDFTPHDKNDRPGKTPSLPGVYIFFSGDNHPVYVGQSDNIGRRLGQHDEKFWFRSPVVERAKYFRVDNETLRKRMESMLITVIGEKNLILNKVTPS